MPELAVIVDALSDIEQRINQMDIRSDDDKTKQARCRQYLLYITLAFGVDDARRGK